MISHYRQLAAIHLVSLLILRVNPSAASSVSNVNLDLGSSHHTVTRNEDCDEAVGNPFDILPSFGMQLTDNKNPNDRLKPLELFGDEDSQIGSEIKDTYDIGSYSAVCWTRIVTTIEDENGRLINNFTEYAISFETPGDIPDKYLAQYSIEEHNNNYVKKSIKVPIIKERKSGDNTVREKSYITCSSGPFYSRTLIKYKNNKKKLEIRVSPESHKNDGTSTENKSVIDEICEDPEDDEKTTAIKEELLWQIIRDILGKNGQADISGKNLAELINEKRTELIEKIEEIMPDNANKTDSILDETVQKIKRDEFQSSNTKTLTGGAKIYSSQWGTSTNSESSELESADTSSDNELTENLQNIERTFTIKVTEFVSHRRGVILDEIMRHMKVSCYDISENILETDCPAQLDIVPTMDSTKLPSFVSYSYKREIPESVKQNSFLVTDPLRKACYHLVKVRKVECPSDTSNLLNLRIVTYARNMQATATENPTYMTVFPTKVERTFTIKVTEFVSQRRGVILDEIMRHMKVSCYDISENILETDCPAQLDIVPTMDSTNLPSFVSYSYKREIPESVKQNSFLVTDPLRKACYHLVKVRKVECPSDTSNLLNLRIVTYARNSQATTTDKHTHMTAIATQVERTFTIKVTEFVSHRRGVILDEIMRHMKVSCYDISENILETDCPAQLDIVPTMDSTKLPSFVSYSYKREIPDSVQQNSFLVTDPLRKACYHLVKVRKVECPSDTSNLLNLRIVTYARNSQATTPDKHTHMTAIATQVERTFTIKVTEFVSHRRGVILDEIMRHMKVSCYDISEKILETDCPAQLDIVPTMDSTKLPSFVSYSYKRDIPESVKQNSFLVTDPLRKACYHLVKVRKVECPSDTNNLLNLRIVTYARNMQATATENPTYMTVFPTKVERTFTIKVTEFVSQRRGVILDEIMRHMKVSCYDISENILETDCPAQLDIVPTMDSTKLPSFVSYSYKRDIPESVKQNSFLVTDPLRKACYHLVKVRKVECPSDTSNLLNLRIVTYARNSQATTPDKHTHMTAIATQVERTFTIKVTEFVSHRRGVILDEIMRHMKVSCYDISEKILETDCPAQLDIVPTMDSTKLPSFVSYSYKRDIPESIKQNSFLVTDPLRKACYHLVKVRKVECPSDTNNLLNLRIVTYARNMQATATENPTYMTVFPTKVERTFTIKVTEFVSHRRGVILDEIMRHMKVSCYDISENILETDCPAQLDIVPTMDSTKLPSFVSYSYKREIPESVKQNSFLVTDPLRKACYHLVKVRKVECPSDTSNLLNLRIVTYARNMQATATENPTYMTVFPTKVESTFTIKVTEFVSHRRGVILDEIMRHMKVSCYDISENILETDCPAQLDIVPTMDSTKLPSFVSYSYKREIPESVKQNSFLVTDPLRKACYHLVKVRKVECPSDTSNLLNLRIVTYARNMQATATENPTYMTVFPTKVERTFTIKVTEFVSQRRGVILDEIMRHMKVSCYDISENILETDCPAQLDIVPTMDSTKLPSFVSYSYKRDIPESIKQNSFLVTDPLRKACYHLVKVRKVECPSDTNNLLNLRIVTYARNMQATATENPTYMTVFPTKVERTFTIKVTEFVSHRRGVILDEIMRHMKVSCYDISENILETDCPAQLDIVPTMDSTKLPSFVSYSYKRDIPESVKQNSFLVTDPLRKACYHLVKVRKVECPSDTSNLLNLRIVTYARNMQATATENPTYMTVFPTKVERTFTIKVTEFVSQRRGVILDEIMRHMKVSCYDISENILETDCPAQLDIVPTMDSTKLPSFVSYSYKREIPESVKQNSFLVTDPLRKACYHLVKVRKVECPSDTSNLLNLRIVTYARNSQATTPDKHTHMTAIATQVERTFTIKVTEFVSHRRGVILDEIMRHMKVSCYDISEKILETDCPAQLDIVPTMDSTKLPSFVSYSYKRDIPESVKQNSFLVTDPLRKACYHLVKVRKVECPSDTSNLLNLRIVTYAGNSQATTPDKHTHMTAIATQVERTFTIKVTEFVSHRRGVILDEIMRHMKVSCYDISENILKTDCPAQLDIVPTMDSTKLPSFVSYSYKREIPESVKQNSFLVTDPLRKACYHLVKVRKVECPSDTSNLLNLRIVTYARNMQATATENPTYMTVFPTKVERTFTIKVTEFVSHRRGVILDEIMRHMKVSCYHISENILETDCPAQLDIVTTMDSTKLPSFVSYSYKREIPESVKQNSFLVTDPLRQACYHLVKVRKVECPSDTNNLLNLRIVTYAGNSQSNNLIRTSTTSEVHANSDATHPENHAKYIDSNNIHTKKKIEENVMKKELADEIMEDIRNGVGDLSIKKELLKEVVEDIEKEKLEPEWHLTKYIDSNNVVYCFKENANSLIRTTCPVDTANLQFVSFTHGKFFLARYIDNEGRTHCVHVYDHLLKPTSCPSDVMNLPVVQTTNKRPLLVKFLDKQKNVHCYLQYPNRLEHTTCSNDYSIFPEISMKNQIYLAQYVDFYKNRFCFEVHDDFIKRVSCPSETLPFLHLSSVQSFIGKVEIGNGIEFCYIVYSNYWKPTSCPDETSDIPVIFSSSSDLYIGKITDSANQDFCYFVYKNSLKPAPCPLDTSNLPSVDLVNGKSYTGRIVDASNKEHCFTVFEDSMVPVACPGDTSRLPFITLSNNSEYSGKMKTDEKNLSLPPMPNIVDKQVKKDLSKRKIEEKVMKEELAEEIKEDIRNELGDLPIKKELLEEVVEDLEKEKQEPEWYFTKYVDSNNVDSNNVDTQAKKDHTKWKIEQKVIKKELADEIIDDIGNELGDLPIKKELLEEVVEDLQKEKLEPEWYFTKYVDSNNIIYCFKENANSLTRTTCPEDTANLQLVSLTQGRYFLARYIDNEGRTHCVHVYDHLLKPTSCPSDVMNLPVVQTTNERPLLVKFLDKQKNVHCYLQYPNRLEHTTCLNDYLIFPEISMKNQIYLAQYVDFYKNRFCFEVHNDFIKKVSCPSETLPFLHLSSEQSFIGKVEIGNGIEFCYIVYSNYWKPTSCPDDTSDIPVIFSSSSDLYIGKITDSANQDFCYFVYKNSLKPAPCPLDTSNLPSVDLVNGKSYTGRIVDASNKEHCFTVFEDSMVPVACPGDTSRLPFITLANNSEYSGKMKTDEKNLSLPPMPNIVDKQVKKDQSKRKIEEKVMKEELAEEIKEDIRNELGDLPIKKELLEEVVEDLEKEKQEPEWYFTKYVDSNKVDSNNVDTQAKKDQSKRKIEEKVMKEELAEEIIEDIGNELGDLPIKKELLEEVVEDLEIEKLEPEWYFTKYVDSNNVVYCFKENAKSLTRTTCPEDTANLQFVSFTHGKFFLARYIDNEGRTHCVHVYDHLLKPTSCPSDVMNLPVVQTTNERPLLVKFLDKQKNVHCYLQYPNRLEHTTCSNDYLIFPEISMKNQIYLAQYVDFYKNRFCFEVHNDFIKKVSCPSETLPFLNLSSEQSFIGKVEIGNGIEFCYIVYSNYWKPTSCPDDTSDIPVIFSSSSDLYIGKITDSANQDFCYFVYKDSLKPAPCPLDTSNLPSVDLVNGKSYTGRIVDASNKEHCFTVFEDSMVPVACPRDTSRLPFITLANNSEYSGKMKTDEKNLSLPPMPNIVDKQVKKDQSKRKIEEKVMKEELAEEIKEDIRNELGDLPIKKELLEEVVEDLEKEKQEPEWYFTKYVDSNNVDSNNVDTQAKKDHTKWKIEQKVIKKELANEIIEDIGNELGDLPIKKELLEEVVEDLEKEKLEPEWYFTKYVDSNNVVYCFKENANSLTRTTCPEDTTNLQFVSLTQGRFFLARYIDNEGRTLCVHVYDHLLKPTSCPSDVMNLPVVQTTNERALLVKFLDKEKNVHCYLQYHNRLEHTTCSDDHSTLHQQDEMGYLAKYVDSLGHIKCFVVYKNFMQNTVCPVDTSLLPLAPMSTNVEWYGKYVTALGDTICLKIQGDTRAPVPCPDDAHMLPTVENSLPKSVTLHRKEIRELIKVMCKGKFYSHFQKNNNSVALQKLRQFLP